MAGTISSAALVGCTGLVGSQILTSLLSLSSQPTVHAIARKTLPTTSPNLKTLTEADSSKWSGSLRSLSPVPDAFLSAIGTTRGQAGSLAAQRAVDFDLNLSLAKAAKDAGVKVYVLISSSGASAGSLFPYMKMKGEVEEAVKALNFPHTVIVRPGLLVGKREDSRPSEAVFRVIANGLGRISKPALTDWWAQDVDVIGRATVAAAKQCVEGKKEPGVWIVSQKEIMQLGK